MEYFDVSTCPIGILEQVVETLLITTTYRRNDSRITAFSQENAGIFLTMLKLLVEKLI